MKRGIVAFMGLLLLLLSLDAVAQCAMCSATVKSNLEADQAGIGSSLNTGILYLMSLPYLLFATIGFFWYRHSKANKKRKEEEARRKALLKQVLLK